MTDNNLATVFTDLHIHCYKQFDKDGSRLEHCVNALAMVFKFSQKNGIKTILFPGDLFDQQKTLPTQVVTETIKQFKKLFEEYPEITFYAITGNHDQASKSLLDSPAISALEHLAIIFEGRFELLDNSHSVINGCVVAGVPYYEYGEHFKTALSVVTERASLEMVKAGVVPMVLMMHQTPQIAGSVMPADCDPTDVMFKPWDYVLNGHIHKHEQLTDRFVNVGTMLHRDLGDEGQEKGFLVMDLNNPSAGFRRISTAGKFPEYRRVKEGDEVAPGQDYVIIEPVFETAKISETARVEEFSTNLSAAQLVENYWQEVDGVDEKLLQVGLKYVTIQKEE